MRKFLSLLFSLSLLLGTVRGVLAQQSAATADLYPADVTAFPKVTALLDVFDAQKVFASGLKPEAVSILENSAPLPVDSLTEMAIPLQITVAVNQGAALDARDPNGISRFQRVAQVIAQWAQTRPADLPDDFSLVSQAGVVLSRASASEFVAGLGSFQPDFRASIPNLQSLSTALDTVSAQSPQMGMKRAVLFITPQMENPNLAAELEPFIQRAVEGRIRIFIWYVDANTTFATTSAAAFNNLAIQTGATMFQYSGGERFPDPEAYFSPLRRIYQLTYTSRVNTPGSHTLQAQVNLSSGGVLSAQQSISIDIQPPNPIPVTPASNITRQAPAEDPFSETLLPASQDFEIIIEFPDGHPRPITRTALYVDGVLADENTAEPFTKFTWDLSTYTESGDHQIVVEAQDALGLGKTSLPLPVSVTVVNPPSGPTAFLAKYRTQLTFGAIILAGLILFFILLGGRMRINAFRTAQASRRAEADPLTQSVQTVLGADTQTKTTDRRKAPRPQPNSIKPKKDAKVFREAPASFFRINPDGKVAVAPPIAIVDDEMVFGTDPVQCTQILDDPSISSMHARLRRTEDGGYLLLDTNPIPGTWVNYEPLPREGSRLAHGDMVHFGQLSYRFVLTTPPPASQPKITLLNTEE